MYRRSTVRGLRQAQTADDGVGRGVEKNSASPSFMELIAPESAAVAQCAIEMEGRRARIRIELKASSAGVVSFSRSLAELVL